MDKLSRNRIAAGLAASAVAVLVGLLAWVRLVTGGLLGATGMSNVFNWGLLIVVFAFLVGFAAGAQLFASYAALSRKKELASFVLPAQAISLGAACGAGVAIVADLGAPWNMMQMILHLQLASPLAWDMIALTAFVVLSAACLVSLALKSKATVVLMAAAGVAALALQVIEGLLFALQEARAWWYGAVMPVDFLVVAVMSGAAIMALATALSKKEKSLEAARFFGRAFAVAGLAHVALMAVEYAMLSFEGAGAPAMTLSLVGDHALLYGAEIVLTLAAAIMFAFLSRGEKGARGFVVAGVLAVLGLVAHRFMLLYPALGGSTLFAGLSNGAGPEWAYPVSTGLYPTDAVTFAIVQDYVPGAMEILSALLPFGLTVFVVIAACAVVKRASARR